MELEARFQATSYQGGAKRFESNAQHEAAEHAEWLRHQARFRALDEQVQRKQAFDKLTSQVMFDRDQNLAYKTDEAFNQSRGRVTATAYAEDMKRTSKAAWDQLTSQVMFDRDRNLAYKMDEVFNQRRTAGYESSAASHWAGEVSRMEREGGVLSHLQPAGPRRFESNADYEARLASAGGGGGGGKSGGFLSAIKGSGIWQAAAFLYTVERVGRGVERLAEVVEHATERAEEQNQILRELETPEDRLDAERANVEKRAHALNEPTGRFFEVLSHLVEGKPYPGDDRAQVRITEMGVAAGALALAGGNEKLADRIAAEYAKSSQALFGPGAHGGGFKNLKDLPGGPVHFLEQYAHLSEAAASKVVAPTANALQWQSNFETLTQAIVTAGEIRLPSTLPNALEQVEDAFDRLIRTSGRLPYLTEALSRLADSLENSSGLAAMVKVVDWVLARLVDTLNNVVGALTGGAVGLLIAAALAPETGGLSLGAYFAAATAGAAAGAGLEQGAQSAFGIGNARTHPAIPHTTILRHAPLSGDLHSGRQAHHGAPSASVEIHHLEVNVHPPAGSDAHEIARLIPHSILDHTAWHLDLLNVMRGGANT
jgi:hypothetical protein